MPCHFALLCKPPLVDTSGGFFYGKNKEGQNPMRHFLVHAIVAWRFML